MRRTKLIVGSVALAAALGALLPGVAQAADYIGQYPTKNECEKAIQDRFDTGQAPAGRYVCASNGNPASEKATYALYRYPSDDGLAHWSLTPSDD